MTDPRKSLASINEELCCHRVACYMRHALWWGVDGYAGTTVLSPLALSANGG